MTYYTLAFSGTATQGDIDVIVEVKCAPRGITLFRDAVEDGRMSWDEIDDVELIADRLAMLHVFEFRKVVELLGKASRARALMDDITDDTF